MKTYGGRYLTSAELRGLGCRAVGEDVMVHSTCVLAGLDNIAFGNHIRVDAFAVLVAADGRLDIGNHVHIGVHAFLSGGEGIELGDFVSLSAGGRIYTRNDDYTGRTLTGPTIPERLVSMTRSPVALARHVVVGAGSVVLPGCNIGEGTTVGALSLVNAPLPEWGIYAGIPARRLRDRSRQLLELEKELLAEEARQGAVD